MDFSLIGKPVNEDAVVLDYIQSLYEIELIREANLVDVSLVSAIEFGIASGAPWKDRATYAADYKNSHKDNLVQYNCAKLCKLVKKLWDKAEILTTNNYHDLPMEPMLANSIVRCFENICIRTREGYIERPAPVPIYSKSMYKNYANSTDTYDITVAARLVDDIFNTFTGDRRDLDTNSSKRLFGQHRHETLDNKTYVDYSAIVKTANFAIDTILMDIKLNLCNSPKSKMLKWQTQVADYAKVLYKLRVPYSIHPNRLDRLYEKYIMRDKRYAAGLDLARKYSAFNPTDVLDDTYLQVDPEMIFEDGATHHLSNGNYFPNSLVEQYLVVKYLNK